MRRPVWMTYRQRYLVAGLMLLLISGGFEPYIETSQSVMWFGLLPTVSVVVHTAPVHAEVDTIAPSFRTVAGLITKGQTFVTLAIQAGLDKAQALNVYRNVRSVYDLRRLDVGHAYQLRILPNGQLQSLTYAIDAERRLRVTRKQKTFVGRIARIPYTFRERVVHGATKDSIDATLRARGEDPHLIRDLADLFDSSVDLTAALRHSSTYHLLISERARQGQTPVYHRILAIELRNHGQVLQAVLYAHGDRTGYYWPDGRSIEQKSLHSPLRYTRISSGFTRRRYHPILKRYRPHLGIDFAAPHGTPVRSVTDGVVMWVGRQRASGKMVKIRHNATYVSSYMHLSRYAKNIREGQRVKPGQLIGYVGSTGLSTGPHLDFRLSKDGKYVNPLKYKDIEGAPVPKRALAEFKVYAKRLLTRLRRVQLAMRHVSSRQSGE